MMGQSRRLIPSLVLASLFLATVVAEVRADAGVPDFARGARLYSENCGRCHNARGPAEFSDAHWPLIVTHMRVIAGLPGEQARTIEAFLRASNNPPRRRLAHFKATPTISGEDLVERYGCRGCHRIGDSGGSIGPDLAGIFQRRPLDWIRVQIQTPKEHNSKTLMPVYDLTDPEVAAIVEALPRAQ